MGHPSFDGGVGQPAAFKIAGICQTGLGGGREKRILRFAQDDKSFIGATFSDCAFLTLRNLGGSRFLLAQRHQVENPTPVRKSLDEGGRLDAFLLRALFGHLGEELF